jgi:hypothetical protein
MNTSAHDRTIRATLENVRTTFRTLLNRRIPEQGSTPPIADAYKVQLLHSAITNRLNAMLPEELRDTLHQFIWSQIEGIPELELPPAPSQEVMQKWAERWLESQPEYSDVPRPHAIAKAIVAHFGERDDEIVYFGQAIVVATKLYNRFRVDPNAAQQTN